MKFSTLILIAVFAVIGTAAANQQYTINDDIVLDLPGTTYTEQTELAHVVGYGLQGTSEYAVYTYTVPLGLLILKDFNDTGAVTSGGMKILASPANPETMAVVLYTQKGMYVIVLTTMSNLENAISKVRQV